MAMRHHFTEHPASVGESYTQHMRVAASFAGSLAVAAGAAVVHAIVPCLCSTTASERIQTLNDKMTSGARAKNSPGAEQAAATPAA